MRIFSTSNGGQVGAEEENHILFCASPLTFAAAGVLSDSIRLFLYSYQIS